MPSDRSPEYFARLMRRHKKDVEKHLPPEELKARKKAGQARRALKGKEQAREKRVTEENWETLLDQHGRTPRRPVVSEILQTLGDPMAITAADAEWNTSGIVLGVASGRCRVFLDGEELDCIIPPELAVRQKSALAVGDRVTLAGEAGAVRIDGVLPRRSVLARPDPLRKNMQRLVAANIDVVVLVVSLKAPPLRPRLIDRVLIAIQRGGARPVLCVNKTDLLDEEEREHELSRLEPYAALDVPILACSTRTGEGLAALRAEVEGRTAALVGHSGVGKSSILNALDESLQIATGGLHRKRSTGRHTTTSSTLYDFGGETYLIDTPGIREFGLWDLDRESLREYFPEFAEASELCRFTDCTHVHEPDCEVQLRVEQGELNEARYDTYVRLWEGMEG